MIYPIVIVNMNRLLNLLIGRNEVQARSLESLFLGKNLAYR